MLNRAGRSLRLARVERWVLRAGLFVLPLAFWSDTYDHYVLPKLLVARILLFSLLILFVLRSIAARTIEFKRTPLDLPLLLFLASALLSTPFAENLNVALFGTYGRYDGLLTLVTYAGLFWLSVQAIDGPGEARTVFRVLLASGYLVATIAILQDVTDILRFGPLAQAFGTLGQQNVLGAFLALLVPLALWEVLDAKTWTARVIALNALVVMGLCLLLTLSRSAWLGTAVGGVVVLAATKRRAARVGLAAATIVAAAVFIAGIGLSGRLPVAYAIVARGMTVFDPSAWNPRPQIWRDTIHLIASRPLLGYGPDNFGLVYPRFQADFLGTLQVDKAHSEVLQVASTQGLIGLAAYLLVVGAFARAFWRGRRAEGALFIFAGWLGYQIVLQLNFSTLGASLPFWIFAAAAMESFGASRRTRSIRLAGSRWVPALGGMAAAALFVLALAATVPPYMADAHLLRAVTADFGGRPKEAAPEAAQAAEVAPWESVYAVEVGNLAFERGDWAAARAAYSEAARLGTYNPLVYRNLALADRNLGLMAEGEAAARMAVELDRFDPANRALLAGFLAGTP